MARSEHVSVSLAERQCTHHIPDVTMLAGSPTAAGDPHSETSSPRSNITGRLIYTPDGSRVRHCSGSCRSSAFGLGVVS